MRDEAAAAACEAYWTMVRALPHDVRVRAGLDPEFPERYSRVYAQTHGEKPPAAFMIRALAAHTHDLDARLADARAQIKDEAIAKALAARRLETAKAEAEARLLSERIEKAEAARAMMTKANRIAFKAMVAKAEAGDPEAQDMLERCRTLWHSGAKGYDERLGRDITKSEYDQYMDALTAMKSLPSPVAKSSGVLATLSAMLDALRERVRPKKVRRDVVRDANGDIQHVIEEEI